MSHYEEACKKACKWCAKGYERDCVYDDSTKPVHLTADGDVACTAPTIETFAEQQAALAAELLEALKGARAVLAKSSHSSYCSAEETDCGCSCGLSSACQRAEAAIAHAVRALHRIPIRRGTVIVY